MLPAGNRLIRSQAMFTEEQFPARFQYAAHLAQCQIPIQDRGYPPFNPLLLRGTIGNYNRVPDKEVYGGDLIQVDATGCGCLAFRMDVFKKIPEPWFELKNAENGKPVGEDIRFCSKARELGLKIGVDTSIAVDHLTTFRVNRQTHELFQTIIGARKNGDL